MPRPATKKSPIRDLRAIIGGKSQIWLARQIGISPSALKQIENKDKKLTRNVAARIQGEAGINIDDLLAGRLRNEFGGKYTADFYNRWKDREFRQSEEIAIDNAKRLAFWIEVLLRASVVRSRRRLWPVWHSIVETVRAAYSDFDLGRPIEEILWKCKPPVKWNPGGRTPEEIAEIEKERLLEESIESDYHRHREKVMTALTRQKSKRSSSRRRSRRV